MPALAITILELLTQGLSLTPEVIGGIKSISEMMSSNQPPTLSQWNAMDAALLSLNLQIQRQKEGSLPVSTPSTTV